MYVWLLHFFSWEVSAMLNVKLSWNHRSKWSQSDRMPVRQSRILSPARGVWLKVLQDRTSAGNNN